jgi:hypothetical protein
VRTKPVRRMVDRLETGFRRIARPIKRKMSVAGFVCSGRYPFQWRLTGWKNVRTKRTMRTKCPHFQVSARKVCAIGPPYRSEGNGTTCFSARPRAAFPSPPGSGLVVALSCQRPVHFERAHWAHLCSLSNYLLTSRAPRRAKEYSAWSISFLTMNSLRKPRKDATDGAFRTRPFYRLVAAARRKQFGASRAGPSR